MPKRYYKVNDPDFSEYVFKCLCGTPKETLMELDDRELFIFRNQHTMRRFADNDGLEEKLLLLSRIGIPWTIICAPMESSVDDILDKITMDNLYPKERLRIIKTMAEGKIFAFGNRDFLVASHMAAQNSHNQVYVLSYEYIETAQKIVNIAAMKDPYNIKYKEVEQAFNDMASIVLAGMKADDAMKAGAGVTTAEMKTLLALYRKRNTYVHSDTLMLAVGESMRSLTALRIFNGLVRTRHITHMKNKTEEAGRSSHYTIAEKGIDAVMYYIKYILKKADLANQ